MKVQGPQQLVGHSVVDVSGRRIGLIRRVICDQGDPYRAEWAVVTLGPWRMRPRLVPVSGAEHHDAGIQLPYRRETVTAAPAPRSVRDARGLHVVSLFYSQQAR